MNPTQSQCSICKGFFVPKPWSKHPVCRRPQCRAKFKVLNAYATLKPHSTAELGTPSTDMTKTLAQMEGWKKP